MSSKSRATPWSGPEAVINGYSPKANNVESVSAQDRMKNGAGFKRKTESIGSAKH